MASIESSSIAVEAEEAEDSCCCWMWPWMERCPSIAQLEAVKILVVKFQVLAALIMLVDININIIVYNKCKCSLWNINTKCIIDRSIDRSIENNLSMMINHTLKHKGSFSGERKRKDNITDKSEIEREGIFSLVG